jgi:hypothetical protein
MTIRVPKGLKCIYLYKFYNSLIYLFIIRYIYLVNNQYIHCCRKSSTTCVAFVCSNLFQQIDTEKNLFLLCFRICFKSFDERKENFISQSDGKLKIKYLFNKNKRKYKTYASQIKMLTKCS